VRRCGRAFTAFGERRVLAYESARGEWSLHRHRNEELVTAIELTAASLRFAELEAPVALCSMHGEVLAATREALELLRRAALLLHGRSQLPKEFWSELEQVLPGEAVEWRPRNGTHDVFGCTRYRSAGNYLLIVKDVSQKRAALSRRLHRQRLESTGRLVASVAHELRNPIASIVYSAELLGMAATSMPAAAVKETLEEILAASRKLQATVDGLLGYARVGPSVLVAVSLREVMTRAQGFLRSVYRSGSHELTVDIQPQAEWVQGNTLSIEQIFVNLLLNSAEAASNGSVRVVIESDLALPPGAGPDGRPYIRVRVRDNGPGVPERFRESIFLPFFSTREEGTGLGLPNAAEAAKSLGGLLRLEGDGPGACFAVYLPPPQRETA
jgi:signal transduction histidine kinase